MPNFGNNRYYENYLMELFASARAYNKASVLTLGGIAGPSGGIGGPPGGIIGYLPQTKVAYDTSETASSLTPASGMSLLDNLNHIRGRITVLEEVPNLAVASNNSFVMSGVGVMNFTGSGVVITVSGTSQVNIDIAQVTTFATLAESQAGVIGDKSVPPSGLPLRVINDALVRADGYGGNTRGQYSVDLQRARAESNQVAGSAYTVIVGGQNNKIDPSEGYWSFIGGGYTNSILPGANSIYGSAITAGSYNVVSGIADWSFIGAGSENKMYGCRSFIGAGYSNEIRRYTTAAVERSVIGGGDSNLIYGNRCVIVGGYLNKVEQAQYSSVLGGYYNTISGGSYSTIPGGTYNLVNGSYALAQGRKAKALHDGSTVITDSRNYYFSSEMDDEMALRFKRLKVATLLTATGTENPSGTFIVSSGVSSFGMGVTVPNITIGTIGNYTVIDSNGHQTMSGTARPWRDELGELLLKAKNGTRISNNLTEGTVVFSDTCVIADDWIIMNVQLNHDKDLQSDLHPHLHFIQTSSGVPNWLLHHRWQTNGLVKTTGWTYGKWTNLAFEYDSGNLNQIIEFPPITPPSGVSISDIVQFRIYRDTDNDSTLFDGDDPIVGDVSAYMYDIHFQIDSLGSDDEYVK